MMSYLHSLCPNAIPIPGLDRNEYIRGLESLGFTMVFDGSTGQCFSSPDGERGLWVSWEFDGVFFAEWMTADPDAHAEAQASKPRVRCAEIDGVAFVNDGYLGGEVFWIMRGETKTVVIVRTRDGMRVEVVISDPELMRRFEEEEVRQGNIVHFRVQIRPGSLTTSGVPGIAHEAELTVYDWEEGCHIKPGRPCVHLALTGKVIDRREDYEARVLLTLEYPDPTDLETFVQGEMTFGSFPDGEVVFPRFGRVRIA